MSPPTTPGRVSAELHAESTGSLQRRSVYDTFQRHMHTLANLPGETSHFDPCEFGYEWRCEFTLDRENSLHLHFSLIDLKYQLKPSAVLYLVELLDEQQSHRTELALDNLGNTRDRLNGLLAERGATIAVLDRVGRFMDALEQIRDVLAFEIDWG